MFDPLGDHGADLYAVYAHLRADAPAYRNDRRDFWALSRFADVQAAARGWTAYSSARGVNLDDTLSLTGPGNFISADPPGHDRLRRIVRHAFTPASVRELELAVRDDVRRAVRRCTEAGTFDAAEQLAWTIPVGVIARLLGIDHVEPATLAGLLGRVIHRESGSETVGHGPAQAAAELGLILSETAELRRAHPRTDLMTDIVRAEAEGALEPGELHGLCVLLFVAGTETVADFIGNALVTLHEHPDQRALLAADLTLVPRAVEELLRFESPVQHQVRTATETVVLHGESIPEGARVVLLWGAANRDERRWDRPDELYLTREPLRNLAFGEGIHHCLGAPLARLEGRIVIEEVLTAIPGYRITGPVERVPTHNTRGVARLPVEG
jgi:cytochrome P450